MKLLPDLVIAETVCRVRLCDQTQHCSDILDVFERWQLYYNVLIGEYYTCNGIYISLNTSGGGGGVLFLSISITNLSTCVRHSACEPVK